MNWLLLIARYLPAVLHTVVAIENAIQAQPGPIKKDLVLKILQPPTDHAKEVSTLIDVIVSGLNSTGVFTSSTKEPKT